MLADSSTAPRNMPQQETAVRRVDRRVAVYQILLVALLALFTVYPALAHPIEEHAYDAATFHVPRSVLFAAARADGGVYPRWVQALNGGLGGPLYAYYPPLTYLLTATMHSLGIPATIAWRLLVALALLGAAMGMFGLGLDLFGRADAALAGAAGMLYAPYLLQELFERGSPQGLAIALYPWLLWSLLRLARRPSGPRLALAAGCWAAMILLHTPAALLFVPVAGLFLLYLALRFGWRSLAHSALALALGALLAGFYLMPFLAEGRYLQLGNASQVNYTQPAANPLPWAQLLAPPPVFDAGLGHNTMGQTLGWLHALLLPLGLAVALLPRMHKPERLLLAGLAGLGLLAVWMQTRTATPVWRALPALSLLQFRWRLLGILGIVSGLILGLLARRLPQRARGVASPLLVVVFLGLALPSLYPQLLHRYARFSASPTAAEVQELAWQMGVPSLSTFGELLPRWRQTALTREEAERVAAGPIANLPDGAHILSAERGSARWRVELESPVGFEAALHLLYYPGWVAEVDGVAQPLAPQESSGYTLVDLPAGRHALTLRYAGTAAQEAGDARSLGAAVALALLTLLWRPTGAPEHAADAVTLRPRWGLLAGLALVALLKLGWVDPHTTWLRGASQCGAVRGAEVQTDVRFGDNLRLCGYSLARGAYRPGETLHLTLYWQAERPVEEPMHTFVHLLGTAFNPDTGNPLWGQQNKELPGEHAATQWAPGMLYRDSYAFQIPPHTPAGEYQLEIGWWLPERGARAAPRIQRPLGQLDASHLDSLLVSGIEVR